MKIKNMILISTVILLITAIIHPLSAYACDCDIPDDATEAMKIADAVFTGTVTNKKKVNIDGYNYDTVLIEVDQIWKGIDETQVIVHTSWSSCMFEFQIGEQYLLYANEYHNRLNVINCGRSTVVSGALSDLQELGVGKTPSQEVKLDHPFSQINWKLLMMILLVIVLVILSRIIWKWQTK